MDCQQPTHFKDNERFSTFLKTILYINIEEYSSMITRIMRMAYFFYLFEQDVNDMFQTIIGFYR